MCILCTGAHACVYFRKKTQTCKCRVRVLFLVENLTKQSQIFALAGYFVRSARLYVALYPFDCCDKLELTIWAHRQHGVYGWAYVLSPDNMRAYTTPVAYGRSRSVRCWRKKKECRRSIGAVQKKAYDIYIFLSSFARGIRGKKKVVYSEPPLLSLLPTRGLIELWNIPYAFR